MSALIERQSGARHHSIAIETTDAAHFAATRRRLTAAQRRWLSDSGLKLEVLSIASIEESVRSCPIN